MTYSYCCSHWLSQAVLPVKRKYLVYEQPQSYPQCWKTGKSRVPIWSQEWCCQHWYLEAGSSQPLWVYFLHQSAAVLPQCHQRFPLVLSTGHRQFQKCLSGIMKMLQAGKNPTALPCVRKELCFLVPGPHSSTVWAGSAHRLCGSGKARCLLTARVLPAGSCLWERMGRSGAALPGGWCPQWQGRHWLKCHAGHLGAFSCSQVLIGMFDTAHEV